MNRIERINEDIILISPGTTATWQTDRQVVLNRRAVQIDVSFDIIVAPSVGLSTLKVSTPEENFLFEITATNAAEFANIGEWVTNPAPARFKLDWQKVSDLISETYTPLRGTPQGNQLIVLRNRVTKQPDGRMTSEWFDEIITSSQSVRAECQGIVFRNKGDNVVRINRSILLEKNEELSLDVDYPVIDMAIYEVLFIGEGNGIQNPLKPRVAGLLQFEADQATSGPVNPN